MVLVDVGVTTCHCASGRHATSAESRRTANEADRLIGSGLLLAAIG